VTKRLQKWISLSGARQNLGDYLITHRAEALLQEYVPEVELVRLPGMESLAAHRDKVLEADAIVILGGPGFRPDMWPGVYPLLDDICELGISVIPFGLGWKASGTGSDFVRSHTLDHSSKRLLEPLQALEIPLSCRDYYTYYMLRQSGFSRVLMTGCPAWYDLSNIGAPFTAPAAISRVGFSMPANAGLLTEQVVALVQALRRKLPHARIEAAFHHGLTYLGLSGSEAFFEHQRQLQNRLKAMGVPAHDLHGELAKISFYEKCDLHVGFRVHAHIYCLSQSRSSILLYEDARGAGVDDALGVPGIWATVPPVGGPRQKQAWRRILRRIGRKPSSLNRDTVEQFTWLLERHLQHGFQDLFGVPGRISRCFDTMTSFIGTLREKLL